jgi:hypothetical protein
MVCRSSVMLLRQPAREVNPHSQRFLQAPSKAVNEGLRPWRRIECLTLRRFALALHFLLPRVEDHLRRTF